jgi:hypothetical protein
VTSPLQGGDPNAEAKRKTTEEKIEGIYDLLGLILHGLLKIFGKRLTDQK